MKTEKEKMIAGEPYWGLCDELVEQRNKTKNLLKRLNASDTDPVERIKILKELCPNSAGNLHIESPFICEYGDLITAQENVFINFDVIILDGGTVSIGANTMIAPGVHIYTATHPLDSEERKQWEYTRPVSIGRDCWIGGRAVICPGVTVGDRSVIGAGAVVVKDIPPDSLAVGNPAKVIKKLNQQTGS